MYKKLLSLLTVAVMMVQMLPMTAFAATQITTVLDLTTQETADKLTTEGWAWNAETKTLTLDGIDISVTSGHAINAPAGTTIILAAGSTNKVVTTGRGRVFGIHMNGDMTIYSANSENQGTLNIQSTTYGIGTRPSLSEAKDFNLSISNIKLGIHTLAGINICVEYNSSYRSDVSVSMSGVDYDYTAPGTNCAFQVITHNGDSSVSLTNGTTSDSGTMTNWASGKTTLTVTDSSLTTGSRGYGDNNNSIELGNGSANAVNLNIQNSKIVAVSEVGGGFAVRPNGNGTYNMDNISNSTFLIAATTAFPDKSGIPDGNTVTAVSHGTTVAAGKDADGNKTLTLPASTTITSGGTTYKVAEGNTPTVSFVAENASMIIPANTTLKIPDGTESAITISSDGVLSFAAGSDLIIPANEITTITTKDNKIITLIPATSSSLVIEESRVKIPENTTVKEGDEEKGVFKNGGYIYITDESYLIEILLSEVTGEETTGIYGEEITLVAQIKPEKEQVNPTLKNGIDKVEFYYGEKLLGEATVTYKTENNNTITGTASLVYNNERGCIPSGDGTQITVKYGGNDTLIKSIGTLTVNITPATQDISYAETAVSKMSNDTAFTNPLTVTKVFGTITYESSDPAVATVDENGEVTILKDGTTTITAKVDSTNNYTAAKAEYTLTVKKYVEPTPEPTPVVTPTPAPQEEVHTPHQHSNLQWVYTETEHWQTCTHCIERVALWVHDYTQDNPDVCRLCGYTKVKAPATQAGTETEEDVAQPTPAATTEPTATPQPTAEPAPEPTVQPTVTENNGEGGLPILPVAGGVAVVAAVIAILSKRKKGE